MTEPPTKADLINHLAAVRGYRRYLEICTPKTGHLFAHIDRTRLDAHRLMYRSTEPPKDGLNIDFRSGDLDISACLREIAERGLSYDIVLVDPFHEYDESLRDISAAFELIRPGGILMVHDCLPPDEALTVPREIPGSWCGLTYKAYLDFVIGRDDLAYYTVDTDFGCGIVQKSDDGPLSFVVRWFGGDVSWLSGGFFRRLILGTADDGDYDALVQAWRGLGPDPAATFTFLHQHKHKLLRLRSVDEFFRIEAVKNDP